MTKVITCPECKGHGTIDKYEVRGAYPGTVTHALTAEVCHRCHGTGCAETEMTNADRFRAMTDEELVAVIEDLLPKLMEAGDHRLINAACDGQGECEGDGNCTATRHRDCIRRYLNRPADEEGASSPTKMPGTATGERRERK